MKSYFIANIIPKGMLLKDFSQAANNFCWKLIDANCFDKAYACLPINIPSKLSYMNIDNVCNIQCRIFPHRGFLRFVNAFIESIYLVYKIGMRKKIWFYNITSYNVMSYFILKFLLRNKVYIILADFTPLRCKISLQATIWWAICKSDGIISLSSRTDFKHKNMSFLAGIVPECQIQTTIERVHQSNKRIFLFSGVLGDVTGLPMAIEAFREIPEAQLYITGNGNSECLNVISQKYPNIKYIGYLPYEKYLSVLKTADVCLNFRNPFLPENRNNFPSKVLEFFSWNKAVLSTMDYPELKDFKYLKVPYQKRYIIQEIKRILLLSEEELSIYQDNRIPLRQNFSVSVWRDTIKEIENNSNGKNKVG